jgi:hypothetical protein
MPEVGGGAIVNVSSLAAIVGVAVDSERPMVRQTRCCSVSPLLRVDSGTRGRASGSIRYVLFWPGADTPLLEKVIASGAANETSCASFSPLGMQGCVRLATANCLAVRAVGLVVNRAVAPANWGRDGMVIGREGLLTLVSEQINLIVSKQTS